MKWFWRSFLYIYTTKIHSPQLRGEHTPHSSLRGGSQRTREYQNQLSLDVLSHTRT